MSFASLFKKMSSILVPKKVLRSFNDFGLSEEAISGLIEQPASLAIFQLFFPFSLSLLRDFKDMGLSKESISGLIEPAASLAIFQLL